MPKEPKTAEEKQTPLMKQYTSIKARYPDTILFFRMGDFFRAGERPPALAIDAVGAPDTAPTYELRRWGPG